MLKKCIILMLTAVLMLNVFACGTGTGSSSSSPISSVSQSKTSSSSASSSSPSSSSATSSEAEASSSSSLTDEKSSISSEISSESSSSSSSSEKEECSHDLIKTTSLDPTEENDGYINYVCSKCTEDYQLVLPKLSAENYTVNVTEATCVADKVIEYTSETYGTYKVTKANTKVSHSTYGGVCDTCKQTINNLQFDGTGIQVYSGGGYPRLYTLQDGTWLCGFDTGKIMVCRSTDKGQTWSSPTQVSPTNLNDYNCANVMFYQLSDGRILCAYRVQRDFGTTQSDGRLYERAIYCSISSDNGYTWQYYNYVAGSYNFKNEPTAHVDVTSKTYEDVNNVTKSYTAAGVFEPFIGEINGQVVVWYADDITPLLEGQRKSSVSVADELALNYETQYIFQKTLNLTTNSWENRKIIYDGTVQKTCADGVTDYSRDGMPAFAKLNLPEHEGWYVSVVEGTYRRKSQHGQNDFIIVFSLSKDNGQTWSTPKEVYVPHIYGGKASAPFVCVTEDDRLIISFQTDEDVRSAGLLGSSHPDQVSVMKVIISDGTPVDKITGPENFYDAVNPFNAPPKSCTAWNGMMIDGNDIWCCTGSNYPTGSIRINKSAIPVLDVSSYGESETSTSGITANSGSFANVKGWVKTTSNNSLATYNNTTLYNGTVSCDVIPHRRCDSGLVFRVSSTSNNFWEAGSSYYTLLINSDGVLLLGKISSGAWSLLTEFDLRDLSVIYKSYINKNDVYKLKVVLNDKDIRCFVNGVELIHYVDENVLTGNKVGFRSAQSGTYFSNFEVTSSTSTGSVSYSTSDGVTVRNGSVTVNNNVITANGSNNLATVQGQAFNGTITCKVKPTTANDCGIVFRIKTSSEKYWEANTATSYYLLIINAQGWVILGKITDGAWSAPANYDMTASYNANTTYDLKVEMDGYNIKCYVNGQLVINCTDNEIIRGTGFGVKSASSSTVFTDFKVTANT